MDKRVKWEACQLFIEQEVDKGILSSKNPELIGREVSKLIYKHMGIEVKPRTVAQRARRKMSPKKSVTDVTESWETVMKNHWEKGGYAKQMSFLQWALEQSNLRVPMCGNRPCPNRVRLSVQDFKKCLK